MKSPNLDSSVKPATPAIPSTDCTPGPGCPTLLCRDCPLSPTNDPKRTWKQAWRNLMSEYRNWWLDRGSRLSSLFVATCVFLGLCIALAEANRKYTGLITEVRGIFHRQEATRSRQFTQTKRDVIENLKVQRQNLAVLL